MTNTQEKCDCEEMSCKEGCTRNHTCKKISCEKCDNTQETWREGFRERFKDSFSGGDMNCWESAEPIIDFTAKELEQAITRTRLEVREELKESIPYSFCKMHPNKFVKDCSNCDFAAINISDALSLPSLQITDEKK